MIGTTSNGETRRSARYLVAGVVLVTLAACTSSESSAPAETGDTPPSTESATTDPTFGLDADSLRVVQGLLDAAVDGPDGPVPAVLAAVTVGDGDVESLAAGAGDPDGSTAAGERRRVRVSSVTKPVMAAIVLQLVDEGLISLDDTIDQWLPQVADGDQITIEHLLRHTSGLPDWDALPGGIRQVVFDDATRLWTTDEVVDLVDDMEPTSEPGARWSYSNPGFQLLTGIVEEVTGDPLAALVADRIAGPAGLDDTAIGPIEPRPDDYAYGLTEIGGGPLDYRDLPNIALESVFSGAGGLTSTPEDLVDFGRQTWRDGGSLISADRRAEMADLGPEGDAGLGTQPLCPCPDGAAQGRGHTGDIAGSRTVVAHYAEVDITVALAVMSNIVDRDFITGLLEDVAVALGV